MTARLFLSWFRVNIYNAPLSQLRFNPKGAPRKDLGDVLKPLLDPNLDA